jgi:anti-anti-sigma factor
MIDIIAGRTRLQATVSVDAVRATVTLVGEIDRSTGPALADVLDGATRRGVTHVDVRLDQVRFMDVEGLRTLVRAHHLGARRGVTLTLRRPTPDLLWLFRITGTTVLFLDDTPYHWIPAIAT